MHIYLDRMAYLTTFRIVISPTYDVIVGVKSRKKSRIVSLLKKLTNKLQRKTNTSIDNLKIIISFVASFQQISPIISVKSSKEIAKKAYKKLLKKTNALVIYIDKSEINKKIEVTIVLSHKTIRFYLELNTIFIVYLTKLYKIILALILALILRYNKTYVIICIDN